MPQKPYGWKVPTAPDWFKRLPKIRQNVDIFKAEDVYGYKGYKAKEKKMTTRCNCDASCGENRYHDVGSSECRFGSEAEHDAYWQRQSKEFPDLYKSPGVSVNEEFTKPYIDYMKRPWGEWFVLDVDRGFKVKRLEILPDQAISLQYHVHRAEIWNIVQGEGRVIVDGNVFTIKKGDTFVVPKQALHKITNTHLTEILVAIEVQLGEICSEDDIVRC
jgi:mannose-6-phosphate isomerase